MDGLKIVFKIVDNGVVGGPLELEDGSIWMVRWLGEGEAVDAL